MDIKIIINNFIKNFFVIFAGIMTVTFVYCSICVPQANFDLNYFRAVLLLSFFGDLPAIVYYIPMGKMKNQYAVKITIHTLLLLAVLMIAGYMVGVYDTLAKALMYAVSIIAVDIFVHLMGYTKDVRTAEAINEKLRERRRMN